MNAKAPSLAELPGESSADDALLADVAREVCELHLQMGLTYHLELGRLILRRFFGSDVEAYTRRARSHVSFRALAKREDLPVSYSVLCNAVAVVKQYESLPSAARDRLTVSHHKVLLPIKDASSKEELVERVVNERLTCTELRSLVADIRAVETAGERRGRPRLPAFQKTLRSVARILGDESRFGDLDATRTLPYYELEELAEQAAQASKRFRQLERDLRRRIEEYR